MRRLKHSEHGYHVPENSLQEEQMRAVGWVDDVPEENKKQENVIINKLIEVKKTKAK